VLHFHPLRKQKVKWQHLHPAWIEAHSNILIPTSNESTPKCRQCKSPPTTYEGPPKLHTSHTATPTFNENTPKCRKRKSSPIKYESPAKLSPNTCSECPPKENLLVENILCDSHSPTYTTDVPSEMKSLLPEGYNYRIKAYESKEPERFCGAPKLAFEATIFSVSKRP